MPPQSGWFVFIAALGMMAGLLAVDVSKLSDWQAMAAPAFVGTLLAHFGAVVTAFIGGKLLPSDPLPGGRRGTDPDSRKPMTGTGSGTTSGGVSPETKVDSEPKEP